MQTASFVVLPCTPLLKARRTLNLTSTAVAALAAPIHGLPRLRISISSRSCGWISDPDPRGLDRTESIFVGASAADVGDVSGDGEATAKSGALLHTLKLGSLFGLCLKIATCKAEANICRNVCFNIRQYFAAAAGRILVRCSYYKRRRDRIRKDSTLPRFRKFVSSQPPEAPAMYSASSSSAASRSLKSWKKQKRGGGGTGFFDRRSTAAGGGGEFVKDEFHHVTGRMFLNDTSEVACMFTQHGQKGTNPCLPSSVGKALIKMLW